MARGLSTQPAPGEAGPPCALFLYSPVGGDHFHASCALSDAWLKTNQGWSSEKIDFLQFLPRWERELWLRLYYLSLQYWPSLWRRYRQWTNRRDEPRLTRERVVDTGTEAFAEILRTTRPKLIVSTIGGAAALAGEARAQLAKSQDCSFLNVLVVSGFRAHHHWARPQADLNFVATEAARTDLINHGILPERIHVVGIPVDQHLKPLQQDEKRRLREEFGLGEDPVLVVSSGATGVYRAHDRLLSILERMNRPMDVVTFKEPKASSVERRGKMRLRRLGFRTDFCKWLAVSDLVIGKLGGHTAAETFAVGVPTVVFEPIAGQEEENAEWVVAQGAAVWPQTDREVAERVAKLLDPESGRSERERMATAARRLARPSTAAEIARLIAEAMETRLHQQRGG